MQSAAISAFLPIGFPDTSRVWIYQSSRPLSENQVTEIDEQLHQFYTQWLSHGTPVKGWAKVLYGRFIVVLADESASGVSGCSTDGMVRLIQSLERQYSIQLFDRLTLTFWVKEKPETLPLGQVQYALDKGFITGDTLLFNNTVANKAELRERWLTPLKDSWLAGRLTFGVA